MKTILAIDPGREKCGLAVVGEGGVLHKSVSPRDVVSNRVISLIADHGVELIIIGNGTGGSILAKEIRPSVAIPVDLVDEKFTSQRARVRFLIDNPPRGLQRLIPRGLLTPSRPYDDYVALILAEDYLNEGERQDDRSSFQPPTLGV